MRVSVDGHFKMSTGIATSGQNCAVKQRSGPTDRPPPIDDAKLHPLLALPAVDRERTGDMDGAAAILKQSSAEFLAGGPERDRADRGAIAGPQLARIWAWPNSST